MDEWGGSFLTTPPKNGTADFFFNEFIVQLEGFLNTTRTEINLTALWTETKPANSTAPTLRILLNTTYPDLISLDQTALVRAPFFEQFAQENGGRTPFIDPAVQTRWDYGLSLPPGRHDEAIANKTTFMQWFSSQVIHTVPDTCADAIYLYPQSSGEADPRNLYIG